MIIQCLQSDDIYNGVLAFPSPEHRSTRLATQAGMLYVILYFDPTLLHSDEVSMRALVDKHFSETWIISLYMGHVVDLSLEWKQYHAASKALANILTSDNVRRAATQNLQWFKEVKGELTDFLTEGTMNEQFILENMERLLQCMRKSNVALRWRLMHRNCRQQIFFEFIRGQISDMALIDLLLRSAQLEYCVKNIFVELLDSKVKRWSECRSLCVNRLTELSEYFTGAKALTRVRRDERMMQWFAGLAKEVESSNNPHLFEHTLTEAALFPSSCSNASSPKKKVTHTQPAIQQKKLQSSSSTPGLYGDKQRGLASSRSTSTMPRLPHLDKDMKSSAKQARARARYFLPM